MAYGTSTTNRHAAYRRARPTAPLAGRVRRARAFTLIEAMMAAVILAIAVVAIGSSLTGTVRQSANVEQDSTSLLLARELMEEVAAKPFLDPTTGTVTNNSNAAAARTAHGLYRSAYDDVGEYHGYTDTIDADHPATTLQGKSAAVTNGRTYTRSVTVEFRATPDGAAVTQGDFALVTVTVTPPDGRTVSISRMASNMVLMQSN
jgi:Tfp pilus assembly protein PilV